MKYLISLAVIAFCIYYYLEIYRTPAAAPIAMAAPTPVPQKLFYHSPLDAPSMPSNTHTGPGYYSTDSSSVWKGSNMNDGTAPRSMNLNDRSAQGSSSSGPRR